LKAWTTFAPLRPLPRFQAILEQIGLN
jgi:hypothetical protein